jgi:hypothetical protein
MQRIYFKKNLKSKENLVLTIDFEKRTVLKSNREVKHIFKGSSIISTELIIVKRLELLMVNHYLRTIIAPISKIEKVE